MTTQYGDMKSSDTLTKGSLTGLEFVRSEVVELLYKATVLANKLEETVDYFDGGSPPRPTTKEDVEEPELYGVVNRIGRDIVHLSGHLFRINDNIDRLRASFGMDGPIEKNAGR